MTDTKRVDELEVGDIVIFAGCKGISTITNIETRRDMVDGRFLLFVIYTEETENSVTYLAGAKVTYLGNKKEEETMTRMNEVRQTQKVDCSALYPYFDSLANEESTLKHTNIPVYVRQQLKNIHELFEDVLELTLREVKTLYFERKMSREKLKHKSETKLKTKKAKDLQLGDRVVIPNLGDVFEVSAIQNDYSSSKIELFLRPSSPELDSYDKEQEFIIVD